MLGRGAKECGGQRSRFPVAAPGAGSKDIPWRRGRYTHHRAGFSVTPSSSTVSHLEPAHCLHLETQNQVAWEAGWLSPTSCKRRGAQKAHATGSRSQVVSTSPWSLKGNHLRGTEYGNVGTGAASQLRCTRQQEATCPNECQVFPLSA